MNSDLILLYGPPASGKSVVGKHLAKSLGLPFTDLDTLVESVSGKTVPQIFNDEGESGFRAREAAALAEVLEDGRGVLALGGGTLLDDKVREILDKRSPVVVLNAPFPDLAERLDLAENQRPLLTGDTHFRLQQLLEARNEHYLSFPLQVDTGGLTPQQVCWQVQVALGRFNLPSPEVQVGACEIRVVDGGIAEIGFHMKELGLGGPVCIVSDTNVGSLYSSQVARSLKEAGYQVATLMIPPGETRKNMHTLATLWEGFLNAGMERGSTVLALGGGVVGDLAGFAAATFLRGIGWVYLPTTLLAMLDASLGGKTGIDLQQGKNLAGAFHAPRLVMADPETLNTLPAVEFSCGMAEAVKHGIISDPFLFEICASLGADDGTNDWRDTLLRLINRAMAVKIQVITADPLEHGWRAVLNLGHTIGHAIEQVSGYSLRHGEAVGIGMVIEAQIAEKIGVAEPGLSNMIADVVKRIGLPVQIPAGLDRQAIYRAIQFDKKRAGRRVRFALPVRIGEAKIGIEVEERRLNEALGIGPART